MNEYVKKQSEVDHAQRKYLQNTLYAEEAWLNKMRSSWFHVMVKFANIYLTGGKIISLSPKLEKLRDEFILDCNDFAQWFDDIAQPTDNKKEGNCLKDLKVIYERSLFFQRLTKKEQRQGANKRLIKEINLHDGSKLIL